MLKYDHELNLSDENNSVSKIINQIAPGSNVLELGPATGYMTKYLKESLGCTIDCVEIDRDAAKRASKYSNKMIVANLDNLDWGTNLQNDYYDYILFADVLEHLREPKNVLRYAIPFLKKNGKIITSVPNIGHSAIILELLEGKFEYNKLGLLDETHIKFFTKKSLLNMFEEVGLTPVSWDGTILIPDQTEFNQSYEKYPSMFKQILIDRPDPHVYQYITVLQRNDEVKKKQCYLDIKDHSFTQMLYLQVFWQEEGFFNENNTIKKTLKYGENSIEIILPPFNKSLRIDPINKLGFFEIIDIQLTNENTNLRWNEGTSFEELTSVSGALKLNDNDKLFVSYNNDPQLIIDNLPLFTTESKLNIRINIEPDITNHFINSIHDKLGLNYEVQFENKDLKELLLQKEKLIIEQMGEIGKLQKASNEYSLLLLEQKNTIENQIEDIEKKSKILEEVKKDIYNLEEKLRKKDITINNLKDNLQNTLMNVEKSKLQIYEYENEITHKKNILNHYENEIANKNNILDQYESEIKQLLNDNNTKDIFIKDLLSQMEVTKDELNKIYTSLSWKITKPFRYLKRVLKK